MQYELKKANEKHKDKLIQYKLESIFMYAIDLSETEKNRIKNYVENSIRMEIPNYKMIVVNQKEIGCVLVTEKEGKILLDELYIEKGYRKKGIGTAILKDILRNYSSIYLWVYKTNESAIRVYQRLGFRVTKEEKDRYFMKWEGENKI